MVDQPFNFEPGKETGYFTSRITSRHRLVRRPAGDLTYRYYDRVLQRLVEITEVVNGHVACVRAEWQDVPIVDALPDGTDPP